MNDDHTGGVPRDVLQQRYHHENAGPETDHHDMRADKQQQQQQQHQQPRQEDVPRTMPRPRCEPISWSSLMAYRRRQQQQQQKQKTQQHQEAGAEVAEDSEDATEPQYDRDPTYNAAETLMDVHIPFATLAKNKHRLGLALSSTLDGQVFVTGVQNAALHATIAVGYIFVAVRYGCSKTTSTTTTTAATSICTTTTEDNTAPMRGYRDLYKQPLQDLPGIVQSVVAVHHTAKEQEDNEASLILTFLTNRIYKLTLRGDEWMHVDICNKRSSSSSSSSVASFAQNANVQVVPPSRIPQNRTMLTRSGHAMEFQPFLLQTKKTRHEANGDSDRGRNDGGDLIITVNGKTLYRGGKMTITSMAEFYQWITHIKRDQLRKLVKRNTPITLDKVYSLLPIELLVMKQNLTSILQGCTYPPENKGRTRVRPTLQRQRAAVDATPATETDSVPATTQEGTLVSPTPRSKIWTKQEHEELVKGVVQYGMESTEAIKAFAHRIPNRSVPAIRTYIGRHKDKVLRDVQQPKRAAADATPATETEIVHATVGPTPRSKIWTEQEHNELVQGIVNYGMESTDDIKAFAHRIPHRTVPAIRTYIGRHKDKVLRDVQQPKRAAADATPATETEIVHATVGPTPRSKIWTEQEHNELVQGIVNYGMESTDDIKAFAHRIPHRTVPAIRTYIGRHKDKVLRDVQQHKSSDARDATRPTHLPTPTTTTTRAASSSRSSLANTPTPRSKIWTEQEHEELVNGIVKYGMESTENIKAFAHRIPHRTVPAIRTYIGRHKDKVLRDVKEQKNSDPREATRPTHHPTPTTTTTRAASSSRSSLAHTPTPRSKIWTEQEHEALVNGILKYGMENTEAITAFSHRIPNRTVPAIRTYIGRHKEKVLRDVKCVHATTPDGTTVDLTDHAQASKSRSCTSSCSTSSFPNTPTQRSKIWTEQEHEELVKGIVKYGMENTDAITAFSHRIPHRTVPAIKTYIGRHKGKVLRDVKYHKNSHNPTQTTTTTRAASSTGEERGGGPRSAPLSVAVVARENVLIESKEDEEADTSDDNVGDCPHPFDDENEDENDATSSTITQNTTFSKERAEVVAVNNSNNTYHNNKHGDDFPATTSHFPCTTMAAAAAVAAETETVEEITVARLATIGTTTTTATNAGTVAATAAAAAAAAIVSTRAVLGVTSEGLASLESTAAIDTGIATAMTNMDPNKKLEIRTGDVTAVAATADAATTIAILHEQQLRQQIIHAQVRRQQQQEQQFKQLMSTMQHDSHRSQQHLPPQHPLLSPTNATSTALAAYARGMRNEVSVMPTTKETPNDHTFNGEGQQDDNSGVTNVATAASLSARDFGHASAESDNHQNLDSISIEERKSQSCFSLSISERTKRKSSVNDDGGGFRLSISERTKRRNSVPEMFSPSISERAKRRHSALATTSSTAATSKILETGIRTSIVQTSDKVRCKFCGEVMKIKGLAVHHARWCKKIPSVTSILDDNSNDEVPQKRRRSRPRRFDDDEIDNDNDNKNKNTDTGINDDKVECEFCGKFFAAGMAMTSHLSRWCKKKPTGKKDTAVGTVECDFCGQFFANEMAMRVHRSRWCKKKPLGEQDKNKDERNKDDLIDTENNIEKSKRRSLELARLRQRKYRAKRTLAQTEAEERLIVADTIDEIPRKRRRTRPKRFDTGEDNTESRDSISASQLLKSKHRTCSVHFEEKNIRQTRTEQKRSNNHSVDGTLSSTIKNKNHFELSNTARRTRTLRATRANNDSNGIASINSMEDTIESQTQFNDEFVIVANETKVERGSVLMPMLEITKSPYDGILCAEVDEQYFDELLVLLDTPIINKIRFEMDRSSMLFNESWLTGRIHGKDFADIIDTQTYFPTRESMVLLCLWQSRLMKANDIVKSIVEKLNCFDLVLAVSMRYL